MYKALGRPNLWILPTLALTILAPFAILFYNGALLAPLLGKATWKATCMSSSTTGGTCSLFPATRRFQ